MKLIGLTGRSGAGKGVVCRILAETHDIASIDCDKLSRLVCGIGMPCTAELAAYFGQEILDEQGALRRRLLGSMVFGNAKKTAELNRITHKYILAACEEEIARFQARGDRALILDAPTLFESGLNDRCDVVVSVLADDDVCLERIQKRDGLSPEEAKKRALSQPKNDFYVAKSDYIVYNNNSTPPVAQVKAIADAILSQC